MEVVRGGWGSISDGSGQAGNGTGAFGSNAGGAGRRDVSRRFERRDPGTALTGCQGPRSAAVDAPTRLLVGEKIRRPARVVREVLAETLPNAELEELSGTGHMSPFTHRDEVTRWVAERIDGWEVEPAVGIVGDEDVRYDSSNRPARPGFVWSSSVEYS